MPSWKKVIISGSNAALNSLTVTNGITGSLFGTASYANFAATASNAQNAQDILIYVKNVTGAQIDKGKVVRISGATGDNALIATASYTDDANSANTLGITYQNIPNDSFGYVITEGTLIGIDTSTPGWTAGQLLYLGATGSIIGTAPVAPLHAVRLGQVLRVQTNNGSMYVRIDNGYELGELHDVVDTTTTSSYGDLLVKSGSVWTNSRQLTGSYGLTGSLQATSFTGSLFGTASFASQALSASFASTSSFLNSATNAFIQNGNSFGATALLGTNDNQSLALETNGTTRMFISSSGNIGINTTASTVALQVGDTTSGTGNYIKVLGNNSDSTYDVFVGARRYPRFTLEDTTVGGSAFQMWSLGNTMRFGTNTGTVETSAWYTKAGNAGDVIFNGNLGVGAISPIFKLDVSGSARVTNNLTVTGSLTVITGSGIEFQVTNTGVKIGNIITDTHTVTGSLNVSGSITGSLFGTASVAATSVITTQDTTPITYNVVFTGGSSGNHSLNVDTTTLTYNPSTTTFTCPNLAGTATTASNITPAITNAGDNRVLTSNGGGTINGESNLTFNGTSLVVTGSGGRSIAVEGGGAGRIDINGDGSAYAVGIKFNSQAGGTALSGIWNYGSGTTQQWLAIGGTEYNNAALYTLPSGYVGIATSAPSYPLHVSASASGTSIYATGDIVAFSDQSVKENIRPIENVLERIGDSRGVLYDRVDNGEKDNIGFIAQELEVAFPELVVTNPDGTKAVKYQNAVAVLFEAIKEQQKQINSILKLLDK